MRATAEGFDVSCAFYLAHAGTPMPRSRGKQSSFGAERTSRIDFRSGGACYRAHVTCNIGASTATSYTSSTVIHYGDVRPWWQAQPCGIAQACSMCIKLLRRLCMGSCRLPEKGTGSLLELGIAIDSSSELHAGLPTATALLMLGCVCPEYALLSAGLAI